MRLTVIPADGVILKDMVPLRFDFRSIPGVDAIHALQWNDGKGEIERPGLPNEPISDENVIAPYLAAYEEEEARIQQTKAEQEMLDRHYIKDGKEWVFDLKAAKDAALSRIRRAASAVITAKYPSWYQSNVALGIYDAAVGDSMVASIAAVIVESNRCEDLIDVATTEEEINAVTPAWPVL